MGVPLQYQLTEYDCGPTSVVNMLRFLFPRKKLHPDMLQGVYRYCLEGFNCHGEMGRTGTSRCAMAFLAQWFNQYAHTRRFPIHAELLSGQDTYLVPDSAVLRCLAAGGCALVRCYLGCEHYILLTGLEESTQRVYAFDPYHLPKPLRRRDIVRVKDRPDAANLLLCCDRLNRCDKDYYTMGAEPLRECILFFNTDKSPADAFGARKEVELP